MAMTESEQRVVDGTAWEEFCDALKEAGKILQSEKAPADPFNQAEGYRYLARLLRGGLESFLEFRDPLSNAFETILNIKVFKHLLTSNLVSDCQYDS